MSKSNYTPLPAQALASDDIMHMFWYGVAIFSAILALAAPWIGCAVGFGDIANFEPYNDCTEDGETELRCFEDTNLSISCVLITPAASSMFAAGMCGFYSVLAPSLFTCIRDLFNNNNLQRQWCYTLLVLECIGMGCTVLVPMLTNFTTIMHGVAFVTWASVATTLVVWLAVKSKDTDYYRKDVLWYRMIGFMVAIPTMTIAFLVVRPYWKPAVRTTEYLALVQALLTALPLCDQSFARDKQ